MRTMNQMMMTEMSTRITELQKENLYQVISLVRSPYFTIVSEHALLLLIDTAMVITDSSVKVQFALYLKITQNLSNT